jgi:hypothetical protein
MQVLGLWQHGNSATCRRIQKLKMGPSDQAQTSERESLDRRIAALRDSVEREAHNTDVVEHEWVQTTTRPSSGLLRRASRLMHASASEIRVYGFVVGLALVVGWLVASKL